MRFLHPPMRPFRVYMFPLLPFGLVSAGLIVAVVSFFFHRCFLLWPFSIHHCFFSPICLLPLPRVVASSTGSARGPNLAVLHRHGRHRPHVLLFPFGAVSNRCRFCRFTFLRFHFCCRFRICHGQFVRAMYIFLKFFFFILYNLRIILAFRVWPFHRMVCLLRARIVRALGQVAPEALTLLCSTAMVDIAHLLRSKHLRQLANILEDPEVSKGTMPRPGAT